MARFKHGLAYWIDGFPPLRGGDPKRRPAIYLDLGDVWAEAEGGVFVFAGTSTETPDGTMDYDAIRVAYGLPEPCWAYPEWVVEVRADAVGEVAGRLPLVLIEPLVEAVIERLWSGGSESGGLPDEGGPG